MIIIYSVPVFTSKPYRSILFPTQHHSALFLQSRLCHHLSPFCQYLCDPSSTDGTLAVSFKNFRSESPRG